ncbi:unnamed protein product [Clonostachys chloroleuca]|uniref:Uncharacterized protein n=1 Tax=Clonostachys chloroleuca TaxID=1926264 RepID=A0AA35QAL7_9HYPO|nr:unnamed protein product [Clonostachys chloroleuca]
MEKAQVPYTKLWVDRLKTGNMEALVGLLIANLSKTRRLALNHNFINGCSLVGKVIQSKVFGGDLDEIIAALSHVQGTLERLQFRLEIGEGSLVDDEPETTALGSFSNLIHFNRLTHIDVPLVTLAGFDNEILSLSTGMLVDGAVKWFMDDVDWDNGDLDAYNADDYII